MSILLFTGLMVLIQVISVFSVMNKYPETKESPKWAQYLTVVILIVLLFASLSVIDPLSTLIENKYSIDNSIYFDSEEGVYPFVLIILFWVICYGCTLIMLFILHHDKAFKELLIVAIGMGLFISFTYFHFSQYYHYITEEGIVVDKGITFEEKLYTWSEVNSVIISNKESKGARGSRSKGADINITFNDGNSIQYNFGRWRIKHLLEIKHIMLDKTEVKVKFHQSGHYYWERDKESLTEQEYLSYLKFIELR